MEFNIYALDPRHRERYKLFGLFWFEICPCEYCGCTEQCGFGLNLILFGLSVQFG